MVKEYFPKKTGQSIDELKRELVAPLLTNHILDYQERRGILTPTVFDLGSGDGSSLIYTLEELNRRGKPVGGVIHMDADDTMINSLTSSWYERSTLPGAMDVGLFLGDWRSMLYPIHEGFEETVDIVNAQMIFHQILRDGDLAYLMAGMIGLMKQDGVLLATDLHPAYIRYLIDNESDKLDFDINTGVGRYYFDDGGSALVKHRSLQQIKEIGVGLGFVNAGTTEILPKDLSVINERHRRLVDLRVPMFYMHQMVFDRERVRSLEYGEACEVEREDNKLWITFSEGEKAGILLPDDLRIDLARGDHVMLCEVAVAEKKCQYLNIFINRDDEKQTGWWRLKYNILTE